jgi:hypothetical protein
MYVSVRGGDKDRLGRDGQVITGCSSDISARICKLFTGS